MKIELYSVKDVKANRFTGVVMFPSEAVALRAFTTAVNQGDSGTLLKEYPEDAQIFRVGTFDDESGVVSGETVFIKNATELIIQEKKDV